MTSPVPPTPGGFSNGFSSGFEVFSPFYNMVIAKNISTVRAITRAIPVTNTIFKSILSTGSICRKITYAGIAICRKIAATVTRND